MTGVASIASLAASGSSWATVMVSGLASMAGIIASGSATIGGHVTIRGGSSIGAGTLGYAPALSVMTIGDGSAFHTILTADQSQSPTNKTFDSTSNIPSKIGEVVVGGTAQATITFTGIPATYSHLILELFGTTDDGYSFAIQLNADTAAHYGYIQTEFNTPSVTPSGVYADALVNGGGLYAGRPASYTLRFDGYANTALVKPIRSDGGYNAALGGTALAYSTVGSWESTAAINEINIYPIGGVSNKWKNCIATLYGIP